MVVSTRVIALVDGEHYPDVTRWALATARERGYEVIVALMVGGTEKLAADRSLDLGPIEVVPGEPEPPLALRRTILEYRPDAVLDLSDEPVLGYPQRMDLIAVALSNTVSYIGPDFRFDPPITEPPVPAPTLAVFGAGKRVAKTAVSAHVARLAEAADRHPVIVAMGRGGPSDPEVAGPQDVTLEALLARADRGDHAASDYLEDALVAGVPTVGTRRAGGGLAGRPFATNVAEGARLAAELGAGLVVLEGSGASVPTLPWDAGVLVVPQSLPAEHLGGYLGPFRLLLSDLVIFMMGAGPIAGPANLSALESQARRLRVDIQVAYAELQPVPLADVRGKDAFFATTTSGALASRLAGRLERAAGCRVVMTSSNLSDRAALHRDIDAAPPFDVLLTELKAAAVDVAARRALARGASVVFVDNRPMAMGGDGDVDDLLRQTIDLAEARGRHRVGPAGDQREREA